MSIHVRLIDSENYYLLVINDFSKIHTNSMGDAIIICIDLKSLTKVSKSMLHPYKFSAEKY